MRLPNTAHTDRLWWIHEPTRDLRLEDGWALRTPGGPDHFPRLVKQFTGHDRSRSTSCAAGALWAIRWKLGELSGRDRPDAGVGGRVPQGRPWLRDRLPADLRDAPGPAFHRPLFTSLYLLDPETANQTIDAPDTRATPRSMPRARPVTPVPAGERPSPRRAPRPRRRAGPMR